MKTSSRFSPIPSSSSVRKPPARPTKGRPWRSSSAPGASPTNIRSASALPDTEDHPVAGLRERTALADRGLVVDLDQRLAAGLGVAHDHLRSPGGRPFLGGALLLEALLGAAAIGAPLVLQAAALVRRQLMLERRVGGGELALDLRRAALGAVDVSRLQADVRAHQLLEAVTA